MWGTIYISLTYLSVPFYFVITVGTFLVFCVETESDYIFHTKTSTGVSYLYSGSLLFLLYQTILKLLSCHFFRQFSYEGFDAEIFLSFSIVHINIKNYINFSAIILSFFSTTLPCKETAIIFPLPVLWKVFLKLLLFILIYNYLILIALTSCSSTLPSCCLIMDKYIISGSY